jgi:hypothetical protein
MTLYSSEIPADRADVLRAKHMYGIWYGAIIGLAFSIFAWGLDAYKLTQINGLYPWLKFLVGVFPCVIVGGFTGWLSARVGKPLLALLFWIIAASVFAWFTVSLPLQITPRVLDLIEPTLKDLLHYTYYEQFSFRFGVAYTWLIIFSALAGLLQIPLSDSAVFSMSIFGKISPMLAAMILMAIAGSTMDNLNNELLRAPIDAINTTTQFFIDHRNEHIEPLQTRQMHLASLRTVQELVTPERKFIISGYDELLGDVQVLARFQKAWVECEVLYNQPLSCKQVGNIR